MEIWREAERPRGACAKGSHKEREAVPMQSARSRS